MGSSITQDLTQALRNVHARDPVRFEQNLTLTSPLPGKEPTELVEGPTLAGSLEETSAGVFGRLMK